MCVCVCVWVWTWGRETNWIRRDFLFWIKAPNFIYLQNYSFTVKLFAYPPIFNLLCPFVLFGPPPPQFWMACPSTKLSALKERDSSFLLSVSLPSQEQSGLFWNGIQKHDIHICMVQATLGIRWNARGEI